MPARNIITNIIIVVACLTATVAAAKPLTITGPARVIDGDTVVVGITHVRLNGDASSFERAFSAFLASSGKWSKVH
jgi:endonuclease YncB( thermonuclease family)